jgi:hypothetical protein
MAVVRNDATAMAATASAHGTSGPSDAPVPLAATPSRARRALADQQLGGKAEPAGRLQGGGDQQVAAAGRPEQAQSLDGQPGQPADLHPGLWVGLDVEDGGCGLSGVHDLDYAPGPDPVPGSSGGQGTAT